MRHMATLATAAVVLFLLLPLFTLSLDWVVGTQAETPFAGDVARTILRTAGAALVATAVSTGFGVTVGYHLSRRNVRGKGFVSFLIHIPGRIPHAVLGLALVLTYGRWSPSGFGWPGDVPVILAMIFVSLPVAVEEAKNGFDGVSINLERAARTLGAGPVKTFWMVTLPLAADALMGAIALAFGRAFGEFALLAFFVPQPITVNLEIYRFFAGGLKEEAVSLAVGAGAVSLLSFGLVEGIRFFVRRRLRRSHI
ncbi:MAG: ABC transporter permease subunit [Alicyclobacillaceae bacterium]|nr:ABC transporter permease subunit [Alicyclobacillaceae bacterium]